MNSEIRSERLGMERNLLVMKGRSRGLGIARVLFGCRERLPTETAVFKRFTPFQRLTKIAVLWAGTAVQENGKKMGFVADSHVSTQTARIASNGVRKRG